MRNRPLLRLYRQNRTNSKGAVTIEFAFVGPVLFLILMALFDLGHGLYVRSVLYGAMQKAGRDSTLESGSGQMAAIDKQVSAAILPILTGGSVNVTRTATQSFAAVGAGEPFADDNTNDIHDAKECFDDENGNGVWDAVAGVAGLGGTDDVVNYTATVTFNRIFPMPGLLGWDASQQITAQTVLRNQPYGDDTPPPLVCP